ncbi:MAG: tyrosine-type recombinase/integrase [Bacteroidota bacterium]|nr:tyrosine-type recombinase/integrase [Bacteroidota bacterium]
MMNEFLQYLQYEKNYSSHTVLSYHTDLLQFCHFLNISPDKFEPATVDSQQIQQWVLSLMNEKISARSLSRKISTLKSFWRFLLTRGYTKLNPTLKIILPKTKKPLPAFFKENEMNNALENSFIPNSFESVRNQLILKLFYITGIRLSELINLKDTNVDLVEGSIRVTGKRNKQRVIPFDTSFSSDIERYISLRDKEVSVIESYLFLRKNGLKMYPKMVYNLVHTSMSEVSSLHKRSPHVLRHTFATSLLNGGADINAVKELLGHSSLAATQVYTHTSFEELYTIYKQAHPRAK